MRALKGQRYLEVAPIAYSAGAVGQEQAVTGRKILTGTPEFFWGR
jgi:hypothetical protein